jgi:hypothetical protein
VLSCEQVDVDVGALRKARVARLRAVTWAHTEAVAHPDKQMPRYQVTVSIVVTPGQHCIQRGILCALLFKPSLSASDMLRLPAEHCCSLTNTGV